MNKKIVPDHRSSFVGFALELPIKLVVSLSTDHKKSCNVRTT
jgi:hypothetical protein